MGFTLHCMGNEIRCTRNGIRSLGLGNINSLLKTNPVILLQINQVSETTQGDSEQILYQKRFAGCPWPDIDRSPIVILNPLRKLVSKIGILGNLFFSVCALLR